jgi:hypothetical protein
MSDDKIAVMPWVSRNLVGYGKPDDNLVGALESLLSRAKTGEIRAMGWAAVTSERAVISCWDGDCNALDMAAAISILQFRFMAAREEN